MKNTSRLAFGTMQFGGRADLAACRAMFDTCMSAGVTHFDTAYGYNDGASETILAALAAPCRDQVYIATKVGYQGGAGRANITAQFLRSYDRLGAIDLLYLHRFDPVTPLEETIATFADWQSRGMIRHIGLSNFPAWAVMKAQGIAASMGIRIDAIQPMYNLVKRQAEVEILPMARDQGMGVNAYSPLAAGLLTGKYAQGSVGRLTEDQRYAARYAAPQMHKTAADLAKVAATLGVPAATLAVAWVMARAVTPIISARSVDQLTASLDALQFDFTAAMDAQITALSQTPPPATDRSEEA